MKHHIFKILLKLLLLFAENVSANRRAPSDKKEEDKDNGGDADDGGADPGGDGAQGEGRADLFLKRLPEEMAAAGGEASLTRKAASRTEQATAVAMLGSGIVLAFLSLFIGNHDVPDGVLWYVAQALVYAGSIFGVTIYFRSKLGEMENRGAADSGKPKDGG
jgi:hypothetical protein